MVTDPMEERKSEAHPTKLNTLLFMLFGTVLNLVLMIALFVLCVVVLEFLPISPDSPLVAVAAIVSFIVSIGGSFLLYGLIVKALNKHFHLDEKMAPLFRRKRR